MQTFEIVEFSLELLILVLLLRLLYSEHKLEEKYTKALERRVFRNSRAGGSAIPAPMPFHEASIMKRPSPVQNSCSSKRLCEEAAHASCEEVYVVMDSWDLHRGRATDMRKEMRAIEFVYALLQLPPYYTGSVPFDKSRVDMIIEALRQPEVVVADIKEATLALSIILTQISNCAFRVSVSDVRDTVDGANSNIASFNQCAVVKVLQGVPTLNFTPILPVPMNMFVLDTAHATVLEELANCKVEQREWHIAK